ncbi:hypothetical protein DX980_00215 (plasmid) [Burkholderia gladioli]|uniref:hypothetical protein n=1 Tax=Burkholderia gladioli TaxID=28095 RepID=UPI001364DEA0|nr:hypothetical protein [Burkholderia gladioli]WAG17829.1 hypothetical protein DX980_00215 [Burkholderia gladioli]
MDNNSTSKFWLHIPFELKGGNLAKSHGAKLTLLGHSATLHVMPALGEAPSTAKEWVHWLMFDPMAESDARKVVQSLHARVPAFSVFTGAVGNVVLTLPTSGIHLASPTLGGRAFFTGQEITIGDAAHTPKPTWASGYGFVSYTDHLLNGLNTCPEVSDERLLAALELWAAASDENLPRTKFLTYMTILDSLSMQAKRSESVVRWIDTQILEAKKLGDPGISGALANLRRVSHKSALKALITRAADISGLAAPDVAAKTKLAGALYDTRSNLSHQGSNAAVDLTGARELAAFVLREAIMAPGILDIE